MHIYRDPKEQNRANNAYVQITNLNVLDVGLYTTACNVYTTLVSYKCAYTVILHLNNIGWQYIHPGHLFEPKYDAYLGEIIVYV